MNCFNHPNAPAIGICKACSKGICVECAADLDHGLACKDTHEDVVIALHELISKNSRVNNSAGKSIFIAPAFYLFMGLLFVGFGFFGRESVQWLPTLMGGGFCIYAFVMLNYGFKTWGKKVS